MGSWWLDGSWECGEAREVGDGLIEVNGVDVPGEFGGEEQVVHDAGG